MKQLERVLPQLYIRTHGLQTLRFEIIQLSELNASMTNEKFGRVCHENNRSGTDEASAVKHKWYLTYRTEQNWSV